MKYGRRFTIALVASLAFARPGAAQAPPSARGADTARPPGWRETLDKSLDLTLQNRHAEVVALFEKWVERHPEFPDGHTMLGGAYENMGVAVRTSGAPDAAANSATLFETAARHLRRAVDLQGRSPDFSAMRSLIDLYGRFRLNRPAEYERLAREGTSRFPAEPLAHAYAICARAVNGGPIDGEVLAARAAIPQTAGARATLGGSLLSCARDWPDEDRVATPALKAALDFTNEALKIAPSDAFALKQKAEILREQAKRKAR